LVLYPSLVTVREFPALGIFPALGCFRGSRFAFGRGNRGKVKQGCGVHGLSSLGGGE